MFWLYLVGLLVDNLNGQFVLSCYTCESATNERCSDGEKLTNADLKQCPFGSKYCLVI
jgi:hypothetical protein